MRIGLLFPSETEREPILDEVEIIKEDNFAGLNFLTANYLDHELIIVVSGVCKVNAAISSQLLINMFKVDSIINTGVCGGLDMETKLFEVIVSEKVYYHDVMDPILTEEYPFLEEPYFKSDDMLLSLMKDLAKKDPNIKIGPTICGEQFITDKERDGLVERYNAYGVDMETGAVAHVCYVFKIPFIAIRSVTDDSSHSGIDFFRENVKKASELAVSATLDLLKLI